MSTSDNIPFSEFIELDNSAKAMLKDYYEWLQDERGIPAEEASPLAHAADRYLRDFVVDIMALHPGKTSAELVRSYLGNWYIVNTLTPTLEEIELIAKALELFHLHAGLAGTITEECSQKAAALAKDPALFKARLEQFWDLTPDEIDNWRRVADYRKDGDDAVH